MKQIFTLITVLCFFAICEVSAQTTTSEKSKNNSEKTVLSRGNSNNNFDSNKDENNYQTKTTTAPEDNEAEGTSNIKTSNTNYRSIMNTKQSEKRDVTVSKKTNTVVPKK